MSVSVSTAGNAGSEHTWHVVLSAPNISSTNQ